MRPSQGIDDLSAYQRLPIDSEETSIPLLKTRMNIPQPRVTKRLEVAVDFMTQTFIRYARAKQPTLLAWPNGGGLCGTRSCAAYTLVVTSNRTMCKRRTIIHGARCPSF